ncbi:MAG: proline racemase family protein [Anaerolineae bacterium]
MSRDIGAFSELGDVFTTLDLHVGGEPIRLLIDGLPPIPGQTINDKRLYVAEHFDHVRLLLTQEPRGHRDMVAGVVTDPVSEEGRFGIVFMDTRRYPYMCGHGTIGAVTAFLEMGWLEADESEVTVVVDAPSGSVDAHARVRSADDGRPRVESVVIQLEPAFAFLLDQPLRVSELGTIPVDVAFAGGFFVLVSNEHLVQPPPGAAGRRPLGPASRADCLELSSENAPELIRVGMAITEAANQQIDVQHPAQPYINTIDVVEFYDPLGDAERRGRSAVIYGEGHIDRSACGTGTSAKMALLHRRGELAVGESFINESPLGSTFEGRIVAETTVGGHPPCSTQGIPAIVPQIRGAAHLTGLHRFVVTPDDPFPEGFLL